MIRFIVKYYPYALSVVVIYALYSLNSEYIGLLDFSSLINSSMVVFSVLLGFLLTITTLLHTIDNVAMNTLRKTHGYKDLLYYLNSSIIFSLIVSVISLCIPILKSIISSIDFLYITHFKYVVLFLIITALTLTIRFIYVFIKIID